MTILEKIKFEEDWLSEVNLTKENIKIAFAGIRATALEQQPCEDCISREQAIDKMQELEDEDIKAYGCEIPESFDGKRAIRALKTLPFVTPKTGWIPVSERLPEVNGRYLVTRGLNACGSLWNRVYIVNYSDLMGLKKEKIWWDGNVGESDFKPIDDVIAWMPPPETYRESVGE